MNSFALYVALQPNDTILFTIRGIFCCLLCWFSCYRKTSYVHFIV